MSPSPRITGFWGEDKLSVWQGLKYNIKDSRASSFVAVPYHVRTHRSAVRRLGCAGCWPAPTFFPQATNCDVARVMASEAASRDLPVPCCLQGLMTLNSGSFPSPGACIPLAENTPRQARVCSSYFDIAHNKSQIDVEVEPVYLRGSPSRYPTGRLEMEVKLGRKHRREARQPNTTTTVGVHFSIHFRFR